jgi:hypothetical protein
VQVFVDTTGRRRRLGVGLGVALAGALVTGLSLLVAGLLGASPVALPGFPAGGQGGAQRGHGVVVQPGEEPSGPSSAPGGSATRAPAPGAGPSGTGAAASSTGPAASPSPSTSRRGNRPTEHPGNPKSSRTR